MITASYVGTGGDTFHRLFIGSRGAQMGEFTSDDECFHRQFYIYDTTVKIVSVLATISYTEPTVNTFSTTYISNRVRHTLTNQR